MTVTPNLSIEDLEVRKTVDTLTRASWLCHFAVPHAFKVPDSAISAREQVTGRVSLALCAALSLSRNRQVHTLIHAGRIVMHGANGADRESE